MSVKKEDVVCVVNKQLKTEFVKAIKSTSINSRYLKIKIEVSDYLRDKTDDRTNINFLLDNAQEAVKEINNTYFVGAIGYGTTEDVKDVVCDVTIICGDKKSV